VSLARNPMTEREDNTSPFEHTMLRGNNGRAYGPSSK
jgi:hypothetical protein